MSKKIYLIIPVVFILIIAGFLVYRNGGDKADILDFEGCMKSPDYIVLESNPRTCRTSDGDFFVEKLTTAPVFPDKSDLIKISNPKSNQIIVSPLSISGEARGTWFFEGSFSGELLDENGESVSNFLAEAQGEWMTTEFVPFKATLEFTKPKTQTGVLVFHKDNPSDMREFDDELRIPVRFDTSSSSISFKIYFPNDKKSGPDDTTCQSVYPVLRTAEKTSALARSAILELLEGMTEAEKKDGFTTSINSGVKLQKLSIIQGTAYADFDNALQDKVGGSCMVSMIRSQIKTTLKQFPTIENVVISVNGNTEEALQP